MMLDWVTCWVPYEVMDSASVAAVRLLGDRVQRFCPRTGEVRYETVAWDSIRSDSHQVNARATASGLMLMGSPARVLGDGCAVFGSGASAALSIGGCVDAMRLFFQSSTGIQLPSDLNLWHVTRIDVTGNLFLPSLDHVKDGLRCLRDCEGGHYKPSSHYAESVYWSERSALRSGKAYAKGAHLQYLMKRKDYTGKQYTPELITLANKILRLELKLGRIFFHRVRWQTLTPSNLQAQWQNYFSRMIGDATMSNEHELKEKLLSIAPDLVFYVDKEGQPHYGTKLQALAAYRCWMAIKSGGFEHARASHSKRSWYRHLKYLRAAGLSDADISVGQIVQLRKRVLEAQIVTSWQQLKAA